MSNPRTYRLRKPNERSGDAKPGDLVYAVMGWDYGLANDDTRHFGVEHVSVTHDPKGGYPCFTIPLSYLEVVDPALALTKEANRG